MKKLAPFLFAVFPGLNVPSPSAVVHGTPVQTAQPIERAIVRIPTKDGQAGCSATLVAPKVAITAGHCVRGGFADVGSPVQTIAQRGKACSRAVVTDTAYAPGANPSGILMLPDIALIHLDHAPCGTEPAALPADGAIQPGDELTAAGFGIGANEAAVPEQLRLRILPQTKEALVAQYDGEGPEWTDMVARDFDRYSPYYLFALPAADYGTICGGDSGGPVFTERDGVATLYAENGAYIVHPTKGIPACDGAYLQLVTPLGPYLGWIHSQIQVWSE